MKKILVGILAFMMAVSSMAGGLTPSQMTQRAAPYMPTLKVDIDKYWPSLQYPVMLAAQIEQESFWNPHAELCVPKGTCAREYGFGFGQFTITARFNAFDEVKQLSPDLRDWKYEDRFNPNYQMMAVVLKDRLHTKQCEKIMRAGVDTYACAFSSYNGGFGGVLADRRLCANTKGCDPLRWFGNVAEYSMKAKEPQPGYGKSFYQINREYVYYVMRDRPVKYTIFTGFEKLPNILS